MTVCFVLHVSSPQSGQCSSLLGVEHRLGLCQGLVPSLLSIIQLLSKEQSDQLAAAVGNMLASFTERHSVTEGADSGLGQQSVDLPSQQQ